MTEQKKSMAEIKDGFDLIEYPCDYRFKAMCKALEDDSHVQVLKDIVTSQLNDQALIDSTSTSSRTGRFQSITMTVRLDNREQLESIYQAIASSPFVVMTL